MEQARRAVRQIRPYIPGKPIDELKRELGLKRVIKLASNENPFGPSPLAEEAIREGIGELRLYPDGNNTLLKAALAEKYGLEPGNVTVGNGSDGILKFLGEAFLEPGDRTVFASPSFVEYGFVSQLMGAEYEAVPLDEGMTHDLGAMAEAVNSTGAKVVFICNPNNPTGTIVRRVEFERFLAEIPREVLVVMDEAYREYVTDPEYPDGLDYLKQRPNTLVLRTFSKIYGLASLRIGYALASKEVTGWLHRVREPFNVNRLAERAALASLEDENHVEECRYRNEGGRGFLCREFEDMGLDYVESHTNFILVHVGVDTEELFERFLERGIIIRPGHQLGCPEYIRVTIGRPAENRAFISTLGELLEG